MPHVIQAAGKPAWSNVLRRKGSCGWRPWRVPWPPRLAARKAASAWVQANPDAQVFLAGPAASAVVPPPREATSGRILRAPRKEVNVHGDRQPLRRAWAASCEDGLRDMSDEDSLDPAQVAPLVAALQVSSGDARVTILEALVRLPLAAADLRELGIPPPAQVPPLRPQWADDALPGFTRYHESASDLDAHLAALERPAAFGSEPASPVLAEEVAPAAVTRWFAWAVGEFPTFNLGNDIVGWVSAYDGVFRPDLDGLFTQYRRAALAECAAWEGNRRPGTWFLRNPDFERWRGYRSLCWQIGWTVSRGGLRGLVPGLAHQLTAEDEIQRTIAALLIADAAD
jgi:hypothetical protein